jgi:NDP-sugar pyrophosphorylase family protein
MKALVLAAGNSTRIQSIAGGIPKPLIEIGGTSILEWNLRWLASHGVRDVWINLHFEGERIQKKIGDGSSFGVRVQYSLEDPILGTAGAVAQLKQEWDEPFLVVYGDNLLQFNLKPMVESHRSTDPWITVAIFDQGKNLNTGIAGGRVVIDSNRRITQFVEGSGANSALSAWVNAGAYIVSPKLVKRIPEEPCDFAKDIFPSLLKDGLLLSAYPIEGCCLGIDTPEAYRRAQEIFQEGKIKLP